VKSLVQCYGPYITKIYGIKRDPKTKDYMIIMEYANGGNLHNYLQKNFTNISWNQKLYILWKITEGYLLKLITIIIHKINTHYLFFLDSIPFTRKA
jgi:serine/threonine protein kinase